MWDKEHLSRVAEYKPNAKLARSVAAATPASTEPERDDRKPGASPAAIQPDPKAVRKALESLNSHVQNLHRSLRFSVDQNSGDTVVKIVDSETNQVIRQIPSEELLVIAERMRASTGALLNEQA